jgi:hypothetical protein
MLFAIGQLDLMNVWTTSRIALRQMCMSVTLLFVSGKKISVKMLKDAQAFQVKSGHVKFTDAWLVKQRVKVHVKTSLDVTL